MDICLRIKILTQLNRNHLLFINLETQSDLVSKWKKLFFTSISNRKSYKDIPTATNKSSTGQSLTYYQRLHLTRSFVARADNLKEWEFRLLCQYRIWALSFKTIVNLCKPSFFRIWEWRLPMWESATNGWVSRCHSRRIFPFFTIGTLASGMRHPGVTFSFKIFALNPNTRNARRAAPTKKFMCKPKPPLPDFSATTPLQVSLPPHATKGGQRRSVTCPYSRLPKDL